MSDYLASISAELDREPTCTCTTTDRGADPLGCDVHEPPPPPEAEVTELTQEQLRSVISEHALQIGLTIDDAVDLARYDELPQTPHGSDLDMLIRMLD